MESIFFNGKCTLKRIAAFPLWGNIIVFIFFFAFCSETVAQKISGNVKNEQDELLIGALLTCSNDIIPPFYTAQEYLIKFYEDLGFKVSSDPYFEDAIPHVQMFKE